jgi:hypothetical protein
MKKASLNLLSKTETDPVSEMLCSIFLFYKISDVNKVIMPYNIVLISFFFQENRMKLEPTYFGIRNNDIIQIEYKLTQY